MNKERKKERKKELFNDEKKNRKLTGTNKVDKERKKK